MKLALRCSYLGNRERVPLVSSFDMGNIPYLCIRPASTRSFTHVGKHANYPTEALFSEESLGFHLAHLRRDFHCKQRTQNYLTPPFPNVLREWVTGQHRHRCRSSGRHGDRGSVPLKTKRSTGFREAVQGLSAQRGPRHDGSGASLPHSLHSSFFSSPPHLPEVGLYSL